MPDVTEINPENAAKYKFWNSSFFKNKLDETESGMYVIGDGAILVLADEDHAGKEEFFRYEIIQSTYHLYACYLLIR